MVNDEELFRQPQWPQLIFGNGLQALLIAGPVPMVDNNGEPVVEVEFKPSKMLRIVSNIKEDEYTSVGTIVKRYYRVFYVPLNLDPSCSRHLLLCDYEGKPGPILDYFDRGLVDTNRTLRKLLIDRNSTIAYLRDRLQKAESQIEAHDKISIRRLERYRKLLKPPSVQVGGVEVPAEEIEEKVES